MQVVTLRRINAGDSLHELTGMLHRAFAPLGRMGLNCTCVDQSVEMTRQRIAQGECYVAVFAGRLVATITLYAPDSGSESAWYHRHDVASIHQLGVDPEFQGKGLGSGLLEFAEGWARVQGYRELALDTAQPATHLLAFYGAHGYRIVETLPFQGKLYRSVVLSKSLSESHDFAAVTRSHRGAEAATGGSPSLPALAAPARQSDRPNLSAPLTQKGRFLTRSLRPHC
jgi:GNAT superfamily N-acetyltransferase